MMSRRLRRAGEQLRRKGRRWYGLLGNHAGVVEVPERHGFYYVRLPQAGGSNYAVAQFRARGVPAYKNLPVLIEQDPLTGERYISSVDYQMVNYGSSADPDYSLPGGMESHAEQHEFGGPDPIQSLDTRQLTGLRCQPTGNVGEVRLQAGPFNVQGAFYFRPIGVTVDLSEFAPSDPEEHTWVVVGVDANGDVVTEDVGQVYQERHGYAYKLSSPRPNLYVSALVKVQAETAPDWAEILDLRFVNASGGTSFIGDIEELIDQQNANLSTATQVTGEEIGQSFVVSQDGRVTRISIFVHSCTLPESGGDILVPEMQLLDSSGDILETATAEIIPNVVDGNVSSVESPWHPHYRLNLPDPRDGARLQVALSGDGGATYTDARTLRTWSDPLPGLEEDQTGGSGDLWGETWTPGELADGNFQVRLFIEEDGVLYDEIEIDSYGFQDRIMRFSDCTIEGIGLRAYSVGDVWPGGTLKWEVFDVHVTLYYSRSSFEVPAQWVSFEFPGGVPSSTGQSYAFRLSPGEFTLAASEDNAYSSGAAFSAAGLDVAVDLLFKIHLLTTSQPYVSIGPAGIHVSRGNITLSDGGLVDGMDVSRLREHLYHLQAALDRLLSNHVVEG
jgi:hypothetical protein